MAALYGSDLVLWFSSFFDKHPTSPDRPDEYQWHQDAPFWSLEPMLSLSAWLAITPATTENGCVEVIPQSHKSIIPTVTTPDTRYARRSIRPARTCAFWAWRSTGSR